MNAMLTIVSGEPFMDRNITFIVPFRSRETCTDWLATSRACIGTLRSLQNQTLRSWRCIIVCHEPPHGLPADDRITTLSVDLPIPDTQRGYKLDKGNKISLGLEKYKSNPSFLYMSLDADDRVHRKLCEHVKESACDRFIVNNGFVYNGSLLVRHHKTTFDRLCGSVIISNLDDLLGGFAPIMSGHQNARIVLGQRDLDYQFIPFPAAVKNIAYGGNLTGTQFVFGGSLQRTVRKMLMLRPATPKLKKSFALDSNP